MTEYRVQSYAFGDETAIVELFGTAFDRELAPDYWRWRYLDNPVDRPRILLAWAGDELAAHYAVSPVRIQCEGATHLGALSMTTMTHPDHQGRGLFVRLASQLYAELADDGYRVVFGFPNRHSHSGLVDRLGWRNRGYCPQLELPAEPDADAVELTAIPAPEKEHAEILGMTAPPTWVRPDYELSDLRWRYVDHPSTDYVCLERRAGGQVVGCAIVKPYEGGLDVLEFGYRSPDDAAALARGLQRYAQAEGLRAVQMWLSLDESAYSRLERLGMTPSTPVTYFCVRDLADSTALREATWHLRMGVSDVY